MGTNIVNIVSNELEGEFNQPYHVEELLGGVHVTWKFSNGYGASVINHQYSYGTELGVLLHGELNYDTPITDDVIGYIGYIESPEELRDLLRRIRDLPAVDTIALPE